MSSRSDIEAGAAFVRLYVRDSELLKGLARLKQEMKFLQSGINQLAAGFTNAGKEIARVGGLVATTMGAITASLAFPIKAAGDLAETVSKFEAVFGANSDAMRKWAEDFAAAVGRSKSETMGSVSAFQAFFTGLGLSADKAKSLSQQMHTLAIDFGSFHNVSDPEVIQRFISAMSGSSEVLDMFGINIKQAALDQKLLAMGFPSVAKGATEVQKVMARMAIIKESMGRQGAVGDALRTSASFSNQLKALQGEIRNTTETIGTALMPVITPLVSGLREVVQIVGQVVAKHTEMVVTFAKTVAILAVASAGIFLFGKALLLVGSGLRLFSFLMWPAIGTVALLQSAFAGAMGIGARFAVAVGSAARQVATQLSTLAGNAGRIVVSIGQIGVSAGQVFAARFISAVRATTSAIISSTASLASSVSSIAIRIPAMLQTAFITARGYASAFVRGFTGELALFTTQSNAAFNAVGRGVRYALERIPQYARAIAPQLTASITSGFQQAYARVQQIASAAANQVRSTWQSVSTTVSTSVSNAFSYVTTQVSSRVSAAASAVVSRISPVLAQVTGAVGARASQAWTMFSSAASSAANRVKAALGPVWPLLRQDIGLVASLARSALGGVASIGASAANRVMSAWRLAAPRIASALTNSIGGAFARIRALGSSTAGFLGRGAGSLGRGIGGIAAGASGLLGMFGAGAGGILGTIAMAVPQVLLLGASMTALLNPATLTIAAIAGGVYAWLRFSESGQKALASIMAVLQPFIDIAKQTIGGIKDAFAAGDIELAGKIAMAGLKLAFVTGLNELRKAVGGVWGDFLGKLGGQIAGGDFAGAWQTAITGMAAVWDAFMEGIVTAFGGVAKNIINMWQGMVTSMSNALLDAAAQDGPLGDAARFVLGTDMREQQAIAERTRLGRIDAKKRLRETALANAAEAEANGGSRMDESGVMLPAEAYKKLADDLQQQITALGGTISNVVGEAQQIATEQIASSADAARAAFDPEEARRRTDASMAALRERVQGGDVSGDIGVDVARDELDSLIAEATRKRQGAEAAAAAGGTGGDDIVAPDIAAMRGNASAATFSAVAISGMFGGGGPQEKMASSMDKMYQKMIEEIRMQQRQERILERIEQGIVMR